MPSGQCLAMHSLINVGKLMQTRVIYSFVPTYRIKYTSEPVLDKKNLKKDLTKALLTC